MFRRATEVLLVMLAVFASVVCSASADGVPDTRILSGPPGPSNDTNPHFTYASSDPAAHFECRIFGPWTDCPSDGVSYHLGIGAYTFMVRAVDAAGNADPTPAERSFVITTLTIVQWTPPLPLSPLFPAPTIHFVGPHKVVTRKVRLAVKFRFSASLPSSFWCSVDLQPQTQCSSPFRTARLRPGSHNLQIVAIPAGRTPATVIWPFRVVRWK